MFARGRSTSSKPAMQELGRLRPGQRASDHLPSTFVQRRWHQDDSGARASRLRASLEYRMEVVGPGLSPVRRIRLALRDSHLRRAEGEGAVSSHEKARVLGRDAVGGGLFARRVPLVLRCPLIQRCVSRNAAETSSSERLGHLRRSRRSAAGGAAAELAEIVHRRGLSRTRCNVQDPSGQAALAPDGVLAVHPVPRVRRRAEADLHQ